VDRLIELLFQLSGAIVFWAEIISTALGLVVTIYTSWKISKLFIGEKNDIPMLPRGNV